MQLSTDEHFRKGSADRYWGLTPRLVSFPSTYGLVATACLCETSSKCASPVCRIKAYEGKIATLTIIHKAVQKENETLRTDPKHAQQPGGVTEEEVLELKEEFSIRLGTADQAIVRLQASE